MALRHVVGSFLFVIVTVLPAVGQSRRTVTPTTPSPNISTNTIAGTVRGENSETMENVRVDLQGSGGSLMNSVYTNQNGEFEFDSVANGDYVVSVALKDFEPTRVPVVAYNNPMQRITIDLRKPFAAETPRSSAPISVHQLSVPRKAHEEYDKGMNDLYVKTDNSGALSQFQHAIKDFPAYYEAYEQEGIADIKLGRADAAEGALRKSIEISKGQYSETIFVMAGFLNDSSRYPEAETTSRQGIALDPSSWRGYFELARALSSLKKPDDAEKNAIQARDLNPQNAQTFLVLANIHIQRRDAAALIDDLSDFLKLVPEGPQADQARKTRDQLQASMQKVKTQPPQAQSQ